MLDLERQIFTLKSPQILLSKVFVILEHGLKFIGRVKFFCLEIDQTYSVSEKEYFKPLK